MKTFKRMFEKIDKDSVIKAIHDASKGGKKKKRKDTMVINVVSQGFRSLYDRRENNERMETHSCNR